jgi:CxxC-x17-CxxC domain-containing protein
MNKIKERRLKLPLSSHFNLFVGDCVPFYFCPRSVMLYVPIVCAECGNDAMVPFRPRGDRPVYCSDCFSRMREETSSGF